MICEVFSSILSLGMTSNYTMQDSKEEYAMGLRQLTLQFSGAQRV